MARTCALCVSCACVLVCVYMYRCAYVCMHVWSLCARPCVCPSTYVWRKVVYNGYHVIFRTIFLETVYVMDPDWIDWLASEVPGPSSASQC